MTTSTATRKRRRTSIQSLLSACMQFPAPRAVHTDNGAPYHCTGGSQTRPAPSPDMHLHVAAVAGTLRHTSARSITFQAGSIIVEARRLAAIILAIVAISYGQVSDLPPPDIIKTGSFLTCNRTDSDIIIDFGVQTHGRASLQDDCSATITVSNGPGQPDRQLWDIPEADGIILNWDCRANRLYVTDPNNYLTKNALWYTVKVWRAK